MKMSPGGLLRQSARMLSAMGIAHRWLGVWLLLLTGLDLTGCALQPPALSPDLPDTALLERVPFIAQDSHACGPAALAMVLQHYGRNESQEHLKPLLLLPEREGTLQIELTAATRREGFLALQGPSTLNSLLADIAAGFPVIVLQNLRFEHWPLWHYAVVVGFDQNDGVVLLRSGTHALIEVPFATFLTTWQRSHAWALVVTPPTRLPPSADALRVIADAETLAQHRQSAAALSAYVTAARRWPDMLPLWNGLGNLAYAEQRWLLSQQAFANSLQRDPQQLRTWNNLAYALQQTGCKAAADSALQCAQQLAPADPYLIDTRRDLDNMHGVAAHDCKITLVQCRIPVGSVGMPELRLQ